MNSIQEIWESILDRFKNPLLHSFGASWIIANYKFVVVLLSDGEYSNKLDYIETTLYPVTSSPILKLFWIPLLGAVIYVFVLPAISLLSTLSTSTYERWHNEIKAKALKKSMLTKEQRDALEKKINELQKKLDLEIQESKKIKALADNAISEHVRILFKTIQPAVMSKITDDAEQSNSDYIKKPQDRAISGSFEQQEFVSKYGIPPTWAKIVGQIGSDRGIKIQEASKRLNISEGQALDALIGLTELGMLNPTWSISDSDLVFVLIESSWVALLNNRPA